jgi:hypothetical protein
MPAPVLKSTAARIRARRGKRVEARGMAARVRPTGPLGPHRVKTVNASANAANRIHDDETAIRYGFRGGLVDGTLIYAHLTTPLVERLGSAWLEGSVSELRLLQPAYDGDDLTVTGVPLDDPGHGPGYRLSAHNASGTELATLETWLPAALPPVDDRAALPPAAPDAPVRPVSWQVLELDAPLRALHWVPALAAQARWCETARDPLALYREGDVPRLHPGLVLQGANDVFGQHFRLEPWLHTGSRIVQRAPLRVGDAVEIRGVPIEKWARGGHQFVMLYVAFLHGGVPAVEVWHSAIFKIRLPEGADGVPPP